MFDSKMKRKYALGIRRIELGVFGYDSSRLFAVHLTTRKGDDNSVKKFKKDYRELVSCIRDKGFNIEYCGALGYSPDNQLLHFHGLFRAEKGFLKLYDGAVKGKRWRMVSDGKWTSDHMNANRRALGDMWNVIHNAFVVEITSYMNSDDFVEYVASHIMKDISVSGLDSGLFLCSRKWRTRGYEAVVKEFKDWYIEGANLPWLDKFGWQLVNKVVQCFCEHRSVEVRQDFGHFSIDSKGRVLESVFYESEVID